MVAQAKIAEGWDWERLGDLSNANAAFAQAHDLFLRVRVISRWRFATATHLSGDILYDQGKYS
mgnify:CR=1 FL=1